MSDKRHDIVIADVHSVAPVFERVLGKKAGPVFVAEAGFAIQLITASDYALGIATSNRQSVIDAVTNVAAIGISLNPAKKQAYLVPRDGKICLDISYMGLLDLAISSGSIRWGQCRVVHAEDTFELDGIDRQPTHKYKPFAKDRGEAVGVYCVVKTLDGDYLTHAMAIEDIYAIRDRSSAWKAWESKKKKCPWVTDEGEMIKKTCIKQACKYWPRVEMSKLENAIHFLNTVNEEGIQQDQEKYAKSGLKDVGGDALSQMTADEQIKIRSISEDVVSAMKEHGAGKTFDFVSSQGLGSDEMVALWSLLPSDIRSALKREKRSREQAAES